MQVLPRVALLIIFLVGAQPLRAAPASRPGLPARSPALATPRPGARPLQPLRRQRLLPPRNQPPLTSNPLEALRRLVLSAPPERLVDRSEVLHGAKLPELLQAARSGRLSEHDVATFAQSAHPQLLRSLEQRGQLPRGYFLSVTRSIQFAGGNPFHSTRLPDPARQQVLRKELEQRLQAIVHLHRARGGRLLPPALQLLTSTAQLASPAASGRYQGAIRDLLSRLPVSELERRHAYVTRLSPEQVLAQLPSRASLAARPDLVNFDHVLGALGRVREGKLLLDVYAENMPAPGRLARYLPVAALGEGAYCVDDIARGTVALLQAYRSSPRPELLGKARAGLAFVRMMQAGDGEFYNFASLKDGRLEVNRQGTTSRKGLDYWAVRGVWALGEATAALGRNHPRLAAEAAAALERSLPRLEVPLRRYGEYATVEGRKVPAWLINNAADQTAVAVKGLLPYHEALPAGAARQRVGQMIGKYCDGISSAQIKESSAPDRGRFLHSVSSPSDRHLWGSQQVEVLAQAGKLLGRADWIQSAALCADHYWGKHTPASIVAPGEAQIAYGVETVVSGLARLHEATGKKAYAEAAFRWGSWFFGGNQARALMYDPVSGRGHDGITHLRGPGGRTRYSVNLNAGAESTIEALLAMQSASRVPGLHDRLRAFLAERLPR